MSEQHGLLDPGRCAVGSGSQSVNKQVPIHVGCCTGKLDTRYSSCSCSIAVVQVIDRVL